MDQNLRRLHPASMLIELLRRLGSLAYVFAVALALRFFGGSANTDTYDYIIAGVAVFSAVGSVFRYLTLRFGVQNQHLIVRSGLIFRQNRTIPLNRIQNVALKRTLLHRVLGLVDLDVETAGGATAEAKLSALSTADAEVLKADLMQRAAAGEAAETATATISESTSAAAAISERAPAGAASAARAGESGEVLWSAKPGDLLFAGATENRLGVIIAGIAGLAYTFQEVAERYLRAHAVEWFDAAKGRQTLLVLLVIGGALLLMLVGWLASIAITFVNYYGFQLRRDDRRLRVRYGSLTHVEKLVPTTRVQTIRLDAAWLRRRLGFVAARVESAGSALEQAAGESTPLCPLIRVQELPVLVRHVFPTLRMEGLRWLPVSRLTIRRGFIRYSFLALLLSAPIVHAFGWESAWTVALGLVLAGLAAWARYRALAYAEHGDFVLARDGILTRRTWIIPQTKIQWIELVQSPFQRRMRLASVAIHTAAGSHAAGIVDLPETDARELQERLSLASNQFGLVLDGV
ncbi:MAG: PH domain-containing protein [Planctomycetes bacterium]|nr:PH domain-containing protein [Planctomycetota bacterium]